MNPSAMYRSLKRALDIIVVLTAAPLALPVAFVVALAVKLTSPGPVLHWSRRVGADERIFEMPKFRTMTVGTPQVATHLLPDPANSLTPTGAFLRRSSLDEIPQLWCVLRGEMTLVGPRPALFNQDDLIALRREAGVSSLQPGITGLAQIRGRDDLSISQKVAYDARYLVDRSLMLDVSILVETAVNVIRRKGIQH